MAFIQLDYLNAIAQAKKLEAAADRCGEALKTLRSQAGSSEQFWQGNSGKAMRAKMAETANQLSAAQSELLAIAATIRKVAEELKETDTGLAALFRR